MSMQALFMKMRHSERLASEFYSLISQNIISRHINRKPGSIDAKKFQVLYDEQQLSEEFENLSKEELVHEREIEMAKNYFTECEDSFIENENALQMIEGVIQNIKKERELFIKNLTTISTEEILRCALNIEENMEARHKYYYFQISDLNLRKLFQHLLSQDGEHIKRIKKLFQ